MRIIAIPKTLAIVAIYLVITPLVHLSFGLDANGLFGPPRLPLLALMATLFIGLIVVAFDGLKDQLPVEGKVRKGMAFVLFYLLAVLAPSSLGMIAFERGAEWQLFTAKKIAVYFTLGVDIVALLVAGAMMGLFFPSTKSRRLAPRRSLTAPALVGAIVFPVTLWGAGSAVLRLLGGLVDSLPQTLWFNLTFYGVFLVTGACLPFLHLITRRSGFGRARGVLATTLVFAVLWLPTQNFMVVFGWSFLGPFVFSLVSMGPVALTVALADALMGRDTSEDRNAGK